MASGRWREPAGGRDEQAVGGFLERRGKEGVRATRARGHHYRRCRHTGSSVWVNGWVRDEGVGDPCTWKEFAERNELLVCPL